MRAKMSMKVSGSVTSAFLSSSAALILVGLLAYFRGSLSLLEIYPAAGTLVGIWIYSYVGWLVAWFILYTMLRRKESAGTLGTCVAIFMVSMLLSILLIEASLKWSLLL